MIHVPESVAAPHEVHLGQGPRIVVRRVDRTVDAGIDDYERFNTQRESRSRSRGDLFPVADARTWMDLPPGTHPPLVTVAIRPRGIPYFPIALDGDFDERILRLAHSYRVAGSGNALALPRPHGLVIKDLDRRPHHLAQAEVYGDGLVRCVRLLQPYPAGGGWIAIGAAGGTEGEVLSYADIIQTLARMVRFGAETLSSVRPVSDLEIRFTVENCGNHRLRFPVVPGWEDVAPMLGEEGDTPFVQGVSPLVGGAFVRVDSGGGVPDEPEQLFPVANWVARVFSASVPRERIVGYLRRALGR